MPITTAYYDKQVFDLTNPDDIKILLDKVLLDLSGLEYQIPEMVAATEWQRTKKVDVQEAKLRDMEANDKENTDDYRNAVNEYDAQLAKLETMEQNSPVWKIKNFNLTNSKQRIKAIT
jgi:hypothetical protein